LFRYKALCHDNSSKVYEFNLPKVNR
jgi:hypothetical protein